VLDIGCGDGASAAWLARNGYRVTGIDLSPEAVRRAQARYAGLERLEFAAVDCCEPGVVPRTFDVLLDCGCLHCIPPRHVPRYVANLARWAAPGAELMILAFTRELTFERRVEITGTLLQADFEMRSAEPTVMLSPGSEQTNPAAEMHFVRRSTPV
jgi:cyclopropane fatty-acyl-phospholipid synthase-like methyltransferase